MTTIKFCGLTRREDAALAVELGASHVGVIFAPSPRQLTLSEARDVLESVGTRARRVGVFAATSVEEISVVAGAVGLDAIQLHGAPCISLLPSLRKVFSGEIWTVVAVGSPGLAAKALSQACDHSDAVLLDTAVHGRTGGTGKQFDWDGMSGAVSDASARRPVIIAGGLNPTNVGKAIKSLRPSVVDVSSGVESSPGIKDHNLMRAFAEAVVSASIV